jgi:hypothetical protein
MDKFLKSLHGSFEILNKELFRNKLTFVPFVLQRKKKVALKYEAKDKVLYLGSQISDTDESEIPALLLHEMIHIYNDQNDICDVTINQYHNKNFAKVATKVGFYVIRHKTQGWGITSTILPRNITDESNLLIPDNKILDKRISIFEKMEFDDFVSIKSYILEKNQLEKPVKTFQLKYVCQCSPPHNSIRSGRRPDGNNPLRIMCLDCKSHFVCEDKI